MKFIKGCLLTGVILALGFIAIGHWASKDDESPSPTVTDASAAAIASDEEIARLDREARAIPAAEAQKNLDAYRELLRRVPDSARYKSKVAHYSSLVEQGRRAQARRDRQEWYRGGTLHSATVAEWRAATEHNKLATAADWLASTKWKGHLNTPSDFERMKVKAALLVKGVDSSIAGVELPAQSITEIAAALVTMSNDLGPGR